MKRVSLMFCLLTAVACDDTDFATSPRPSLGDDSELVSDIEVSRTLTANTEYVLRGVVHVRPGAVLTIEKGTVIKADTSRAAIVIQPGAKIIADGTRDQPIVFTSTAVEGQRRAGQWGGIILLGKAPVGTESGRALVEGLREGLGGVPRSRHPEVGSNRSLARMDCIARSRMIKNRRASTCDERRTVAPR